jgi:hypothetical protein
MLRLPPFVSKGASVKRFSTVALMATLFFANNIYAQSTGIKDFRQITAALSRATRVPASTGAIVEYYKSIEKNLPVMGIEDEYNAAVSKAMIGLSFRYCNELVKAEAESTGSPETRRIFRYIDFSQPASAVSEEAKNYAIQSLYRAFLDRSPSTREQEAMYSAVETLLMDTELNPTTHLRTALGFLCTMTASSMSFMAE